MTGAVTMRAHGASDPFKYGVLTDASLKQATDRLKEAVAELDGQVIFDTLLVTIEYDIGTMTESVLATVHVEVDA